MTARRIFAIARKEIVDSARDRRTLLVALLTAVAAGLRQEMIDTRIRARAWTRDNGVDMPDVAEWRWPS